MWAKRRNSHRRLHVDGKRLGRNAACSFWESAPGLDIPIAWAQVYGLSNLLIEGRIVPQNYGYEDLDSLVVAIVNRFLNNASMDAKSGDSN